MMSAGASGVPERILDRQETAAKNLPPPEFIKSAQPISQKELHRQQRHLPHSPSQACHRRRERLCCAHAGNQTTVIPRQVRHSGKAVVNLPAAPTSHLSRPHQGQAGVTPQDQIGVGVAKPIQQPALALRRQHLPRQPQPARESGSLWRIKTFRPPNIMQRQRAKAFSCLWISGCPLATDWRRSMVRLERATTPSSTISG